MTDVKDKNLKNLFFASFCEINKGNPISCNQVGNETNLAFNQHIFLCVYFYFRYKGLASKIPTEMTAAPTIS